MGESMADSFNAEKVGKDVSLKKESVLDLEMRRAFEAEGFEKMEFKKMSELQGWKRLRNFDLADQFADLKIVVIDDEEMWKSEYGSNDSKSSHNPKTIILKKEVFDRKDISDENLSWLVHEIGHIDFYESLGDQLEDYMKKYHETGKYAESEMEQKAFEAQFGFLKSIGKSKSECVAMIEKYLEKSFSEDKQEEKTNELNWIMKYLDSAYE